MGHESQALPPLTNPFMGVWQRQYIQFDHGPRETRQSALWIQGPTYFADVRRFPFEGKLTPRRYQAMDWRQRFDVALLGFAGRFSWQPTNAQQGVCSWQHTLAILPQARPDTSHYLWTGPDEFVETGTCQDTARQMHTFREGWQRLGSEPVETWKAGDTGLALVAKPWALVVEITKALEETRLNPGYKAAAWRFHRGRWRWQWGLPPSPQPRSVKQLLAPHQQPWLQL